MLTLILATLLMSPTHAASPTKDIVIHASPSKPKLISADLLPVFRKEIILPPTPTSETQKNDEMTLLKFQKDRTAEDCKRAEYEVRVTLKSFYGHPYGSLSDTSVLALSPFFDQLRNDGDFYIQSLKLEYPRKRPFLYLSDLTPCVPKEVTLSYPSGHATLAKLYALVLADLFPAQKESLMVRSETIASDRVLSGMHHPTDIEAGKQLGVLLYQEFQKSTEFQKLFKALKPQATN